MTSIEFNKKEIERVFKDQTISQVTEITHGYDQNIVIIVTNKHEKYVVKYPKEELEIIDREVFAEKTISKFCIPHAEIIHRTESYYIQEYLEKNDLANLTITDEEYKLLYEQIGSWMKLYHQTPIVKFGKLYSDKLFDTATSYYTNYFETYNKTHKISNDMRRDVTSYFNKKITLIADDNPVFIHDDINEYNIRIKDKTITGLIDFGDAKGGIKEQDYAMIYMDDNLDLIKFNAAISQDKSLSLEKIEFCVVLRILFFLTKIEMSVERETKIILKLQNILHKNKK